MGPTLVSMELVLGTRAETISIAFIGSSAGYLIGAAGCAGCYDKMNKELFFILPGCILAAAIGIAPFLEHVYGFIAAILVAGAAMGFIQSGKC